MPDIGFLTKTCQRCGDTPRRTAANANWCCRLCLNYFCEHLCINKSTDGYATCVDCRRVPTPDIQVESDGEER